MKTTNKKNLWGVALGVLLACSPTFAGPEVADSYFSSARSFATQPIDSTKPEYAKRLSETGVGTFKNIDWIIFGVDQRTRGEYRANDFRQANASGMGIGATNPPDTALALFKTRLFFKIEKILDPLRVVVEVQDSRRTETFYADTDGRDFNALEPIQAYLELYFQNLVGLNKSLTIRAGRMAFEFLDRRLIGLNDWRNTTNAFQGGRITVGEQKNVWFIELLGVQPLQRYLTGIDQTLGKAWLYGGIVSIQRWSHIVMLQPFYLGYQQDGLSADTMTNPVTNARPTQNFHAVGIRAYGVVPRTQFDFDVSYIRQFGVWQYQSNGTANALAAFAFWAELGYTWENFAWKPRFAAFYAHVSGDDNATVAASGGAQEGFFRFFGFGRPWSSSDYFRPENLQNAKIMLQISPFEKLKIDTAYAQYYTANQHAGIGSLGIGNGTAAISQAPVSAPANATAYALYNATGSKIGDEWNIRIRYPFAHLKLNVGYAYFRAGDWLLEVKRGGVSHFAYFEATAILFG
ncbi:MAG: alginate export family protein [Spirochaetes bacterium]|nr:alginate export family protein [Spirochaetota bacterium]